MECRPYKPPSAIPDKLLEFHPCPVLSVRPQINLWAILLPHGDLPSESGSRPSVVPYLQGHWDSIPGVSGEMHHHVVGWNGNKVDGFSENLGFCIFQLYKSLVAKGMWDMNC